MARGEVQFGRFSEPAKQQAQVSQQEAQQVRAQIPVLQQTLAERLQQQLSGNKESIEAQRQAALQQFEQQRQQLQSQADRRLSAPPPVPDVIGTIAPLQQITGVDLNKELAGQNVAQQMFYLNPENTQSRYAVGAPVSAGIPGRQRKSTQAIAGQSDQLGTRRKDEM